jgi:hypothetical protein
LLFSLSHGFTTATVVRQPVTAADSSQSRATAVVQNNRAFTPDDPALSAYLSANWAASIFMRSPSVIHVKTNRIRWNLLPIITASNPSTFITILPSINGTKIFILHRRPLSNNAPDAGPVLDNVCSMMLLRYASQKIYGISTNL